MHLHVLLVQTPTQNVSLPTIIVKLQIFSFFFFNFFFANLIFSFFPLLFLETSVYSGCYNDCLTAVTDCQSLFAMAGLSDALPDCQTAVSPSTGVTLGQDGSCNNIPTKSKIFNNGN
jgi:hypothetical protein